MKTIKEGFVTNLDAVHITGFDKEVREVKAIVGWIVSMDIHRDGIFNLYREVTSIKISYRDFDDDLDWKELNVDGFEILKINESNSIELPIAINSLDIDILEKTILIR